jgi:hypothetical protein
VQQIPLQHVSPGEQQVAVVFVRQGFSRRLQQIDRFCDAHISHRSQHFVPHACSPDLQQRPSRAFPQRSPGLQQMLPQGLLHRQFGFPLPPPQE